MIRGTSLAAEEIRREAEETSLNSPEWTRIRVLLLEIEALHADLAAATRQMRALPVIAACSDCKWHADYHSVCDHPGAPEDSTLTQVAPPNWCPLLRKQRGETT